MSGKDYDTYQVARLFKVDPSTVRKWISDGKIQGYKTPGGQWRIPKEAVKERPED